MSTSEGVMEKRMDLERETKGPLFSVTEPSQCCIQNLNIDVEAMQSVLSLQLLDTWDIIQWK